MKKLPWWVPYSIPVVIFIVIMIFIIADVPEYTVTLSPGYTGGKDKTETVEKRDTVPVPEEIFRPGYTFAGWWYKDTNGWRLWDFENDKVLGDMTLTARWERVTYTIHLDANGGECDMAEYKVDAEGAFKLPVPTREGYYFAGWFCGIIPFNQGKYTWAGDCYAKAKWTTYQPGMTVILGRYEQDNDLFNGPEEIEWYVIDYRDGKYYLVSKYVLNWMRYATTPYDNVWETSLLREYLNGEFLDTAFTERERQCICAPPLKEGVTDRVFLMSQKDVDEIVMDGTMISGIPTEYAISQGAPQPKSEEYYQNVWYYLRGLTVSGQAYGSCTIIAGVRPAMWIDESYVNEKGETP